MAFEPELAGPSGGELMAHRPGFTVTKIRNVDGGESPNAYVPRVTVEIRVHYPRLQSLAAGEVLDEAIEEARHMMRTRQKES